MSAPYPYLVVRIYTTVYQREDIAIREGATAVHIGYRSTYVHHPKAYTDDGMLHPSCRERLIAAVLEAVRRTGFRMCIVWGPNACTYCEKDGAAKDSRTVPSGGLGTGGVGGKPLPGGVEYSYDHMVRVRMQDMVRADDNPPDGEIGHA